MAKVYTKTGDAGSTGLYTGERVSKASQRVCTYGTIDEAQAFLGVARAYSGKKAVQDTLLQLEKELWMIMADISSLGQEATITEEHVVNLEHIIDKFDEQLEPLSKFILPGDSKTSSFLHLGRTIVRRAERDLWKLGETEDVHMSNLRYLNRLSDLLFILARVEDEVQ